MRTLILFVTAFMQTNVYADYYQPNIIRGEQMIRFATPSGVQEQCVIPKHFPGINYKEKDKKVEQELCSIHFYSSSAGTDYGVCPKMVSTNPGLEIFQLPAGVRKEKFEDQECPSAKKQTGEKIAKFKQSITCSYTPSFLGYYHVSRILKAGRVPPAVIRTMGVKEHIAEVERATNYVQRIYKDPTTIVRVAWEVQWPQVHNNPEGSPKKSFPAAVRANWLFTQDYSQIYGALAENPRGELKYTEVSGAYIYETRYQSFKNQAPYKSLTIAKPLGIPHTLASAQTLVQMKDVSDMVIMDTLLNQQDRVGNIHVKTVWYYIEDGKLQSKKVDPAVADEMAAKSAVKVKEMILKDNECGVAKSNMARNASWIEGIHHASLETYKRLLWLNNQLAKPETKNFFIQEALFTEADYASITKNAAFAVKHLQDKCRAGQLFLDLDVEKYVLDQRPVNSVEHCELPANYQPV